MGVCGTSQLELAEADRPLQRKRYKSKKPLPSPITAKSSKSTRSRSSSAASLRRSETTRGHLHEVRIIVVDLEASVKFFTNVLGYHIVFASRGESILANGNSMAILSEDQRRKVRRRRLTHLALEVSGKEGLDELYSRGRSYPGARTESKPQLLMAGPSRRFVFTEPSGNKLEIVYW
eukprot:CAMPEP_0170173994 /NCGR_PEP_ID=MMETSP0040_2-20121228/7255_1 /TAXON_ID=641309 /ORGANISM="Lotharella oceanica, Strain CCMP622" /LENGTH=176 /DNA_ID=CAMNT_0010415449 /DNA_START=123 /DNA_END=650 /DNA_ORIENTATION=-